MLDFEHIIRELWQAVAAQDAGAMAPFFTRDAEVLWPNSDELFTLSEYLRANCEYPGQWQGEVEQIGPGGSFSIVRVWTEGYTSRAISFYQWRGDKICRMVEYWGDVAPAPRWRQEMGIGRSLSIT